MNGPWARYAAAPAEGPWAKYAVVSAPDESAAETARLASAPVPPAKPTSLATDVLLGIGDTMRGVTNARNRTVRGVTFGAAGAPQQTVREGKRAGDYVGEIGTDVAMSLAPMAGIAKVVHALRATPAAALAADIAGNAGYAALTTPEDRGTAAMFGAGGAAAGQLVNRAVGGLVKPTHEAQRMLDKGVRLTPGQAGGGAGVGALADVYERGLQAVPGAGRLVSGARAQGLEDWNRLVLRQAEVGAIPAREGRALFAINPATPVGREALGDLGTAYGSQYRRMMPPGVPLRLDAQASVVYDDYTQRLADSVAPSARSKFNEVSAWVGQHLKNGIDAAQWKEAVGGEIDAAMRAAKRDGQHSLYVALGALDAELNKALPHFPGMPAEAANMARTDQGYRTFKVLEKAMTKAAPLKRGGVMYPSDLATTAQQKGHAQLVGEAVDAQRVFGNAPNAVDKLGNLARAGAVGAVGHGIAGGLAAPAALASLLGTTEMGRRFLLGQVPWQQFAQTHPEIAAQIGRALAAQAQPEPVR